jgi:short-subunit dehydrogenase
LNGIAVITGTTHGIGRITSRELARAGYVVLMLCRDLPATEVVRDEILTQVPGAAIHVIYCDLASTDKWTLNFPSTIKHRSANSHRLLVSHQNFL